MSAACSQPGCEVGTSGRCVEGFHPISSCPYVILSGTDVRTIETQQDELVSFADQELVDLPSGEALSIRHASAVTRDHLTEIVFIAGPFDSGKTTILTCLYEAFLEAPFAGYTFRGSKTLVGFERRSHEGRQESGSSAAKTTHTPVREGVVFLHLDLAYEQRDGLGHKHLLLSDISGELFGRLRDSSAAVAELPALLRATRICLVLDGEKIANRTKRHVSRNESRAILRSIIEAGALQQGCVVDIIFSKWDVVLAAASEISGSETMKFIDETKGLIRSVAASFEVRFHEIAARPAPDAKTPFAHGLPTLLRSWMNNDISSDIKPMSVYVPNAPARQFGAFTAAVLTGNTEGAEYVIHRL